jgi:hypothetical protein
VRPRLSEALTRARGAALTKGATSISHDAQYSVWMGIDPANSPGAGVAMLASDSSFLHIRQMRLSIGDSPGATGHRFEQSLPSNLGLPANIRLKRPGCFGLSAPGEALTQFRRHFVGPQPLRMLREISIEPGIERRSRALGKHWNKIQSTPHQNSASTARFQRQPFCRIDYKAFIFPPAEQ